VAFSLETLKKDIDRHVVEQVGDGDIKLILCMGLNFLLTLELSTSLDLNPLVLRLHAFGFPFPLPLPPGAFFTSEDDLSHDPDHFLSLLTSSLVHVFEHLLMSVTLKMSPVNLFVEGVDLNLELLNDVMALLVVLFGDVNLSSDALNVFFNGENFVSGGAVDLDLLDDSLEQLNALSYDSAVVVDEAEDAFLELRDVVKVMNSSVADFVISVPFFVALDLVNHLDDRFLPLFISGLRNHNSFSLDSCLVDGLGKTSDETRVTAHAAESSVLFEVVTDALSFSVVALVFNVSEHLSVDHVVGQKFAVVFETVNFNVVIVLVSFAECIEVLLLVCSRSIFLQHVLDVGS